MRKIIKKVLILLIIIMISKYNQVYAVGINIHRVSTSGGSGSSGGTPTELEHAYDPGPGNNKLYKCRYYNNIRRGRNITINAYDLDGNSLIPNNLNISSDVKIKSGTWVGINVSEFKRLLWDFTDFKYVEVRKKYLCTYTKPGEHIRDDIRCESSSCPTGYTATGNRCPLGIHGDSRGIECKKPIYADDDIRYQYENADYNASFSCAGITGYTSSYRFVGTYEVNVPYGNPAREQCKNDAMRTDLNAAVNYLKYASVNLVYSKGNTVSGLTEDVINTYKMVTDDENQTKIIDLSDPRTTIPDTGVSYATFYIEPEKVCIDPVTSKVYYNSECLSDMKEIENSEVTEEITNIDGNRVSATLKYWHYFIPLDTKTKTPFNLLLTDKSSDGNPEILEKGECEYVMQHYTNYKNIIKGVETRSGNIIDTYDYVGDYSSGTYSTDKRRLSYTNHSCMFATTIKFGDNIVQEFYSEKTRLGYTSLKGYNMYFRQIDVNNPFPNGLTNSVYWNGLYNPTTKKVNTGKGEVLLEEKFGTTYIANLSSKENIEKVRNFNKNHPYTEWVDPKAEGGMTQNGSSYFILKNNSIFTKKVADTSSYYKLGCGPSNYTKWSGCS